MEWSISGDTTRFRVAADDKNYTIISSNGGNYQLDRKSLLLLSATRKFETTDKGQITRGSSSISRVSATTNPQTIDTAWVNMAVGSSYWSNRLKNNAEEYDSVKIMHYIEKYEKLYADDPVFINNALNAMQQADNYEEYDRWLMSTPNSILSNNSSHLHNKLQRAHQSDPGLAFEIVRISNERFPKMLYQWIQHSFSQAFLDGQPDSKEKNASLKLLSLCMNSSDPSLQRQFTPLNTWINAKTNRHQAGALEQPVSAIREMGQQYWTENNLGRYSLLTTYLLKEAGDSLQADDLLNYTIQQLEEAIQD